MRSCDPPIKQIVVAGRIVRRERPILEGTLIKEDSGVVEAAGSRLSKSRKLRDMITRQS
jgi:hypothetical protein